MEKLYEQDAYLQAFDAQVLSCVQGKGGWDVILDRTAFYPEGGGQPYDLGVLGSAKVLEVHERERTSSTPATVLWSRAAGSPGRSTGTGALT